MFSLSRPSRAPIPSASNSLIKLKAGPAAPVLFLMSSRRFSESWTTVGGDVDLLTRRGTKHQAGHVTQSIFALQNCDINFSLDVAQELGHFR